MLVKPYFEDLNVLHVGTEPNRAYYIPASEAGSYYLDREQSDRFQSLNGNWLFHYEKSIWELEQAFYEESADLTDFREVPVPGMWQMYGVDSHQYVNLRYPFPIDPPYVPRDNPCGAYVRRFEYRSRQEAPRVFLNFEGVDSCFYVWLNGRLLGYSQVSHCTSEFEITGALREGENVLAVLVLKWCDGSYLEDQDKFRMSGIFRDVYLLFRPENGVWDYKIEAIPAFSGAEDAGGQRQAQNVDSIEAAALPKQPLTASLDIRLEFFGETMTVNWRLLSQEGRLLLSGENTDGAVHAAISHPRLWSAETPYLYTLILDTGREVITDRFGIREIHVADGVLYINNTAVKFHGVNRHDSDPHTGFVISRKQMEQDLRLMKEHNVNAIRTSHYPNAPQYYHLYDAYGFYVIDEADNESHGTDKRYKKVDDWDTHVSQWNRLIADNPVFIPATLDRVQRCVVRDKNRTSVLIWSMGNECAYGCTFEEALRWTKAYDTTRLCHYESARYVPTDKAYDRSMLDFYSRMYPDFEEIHAYFRRTHKNPYLMCEYCHAMGNGPGDLEDYFHLIHQYDGMCGGFIWEWCDHALEGGVDEKGNMRYLYGGDSGEFPHDGNFCVDGLVSPDRKPHTGLLEFKNVYRPSRVSGASAEQGWIALHNYLDFTDLKDILAIRCHFVRDGQVLATEETALSCSLPPHGERKLALPERIYCYIKENAVLPAPGKTNLRLHYFLKRDWGCLKRGFELGIEEIMLSSGPASKAPLTSGRPMSKASRKLSADETDRFILIHGSSFSYTYDKFTGTFSSLRAAGRELLMKPMEYNIWRAPTDNDRRIRLEWERAGYDRARIRTYETKVELQKAGTALTEDLLSEYTKDPIAEQAEDSLTGQAEPPAADQLTIRTKLSISAIHIQPFLRLQAQWTIHENGSISMALNVKKDSEFPFLPRFGIRLFLSPSMDQVQYRGYGPLESYCDKHQASYYGIFQDTVRHMHVPYIKPQENGSHWSCDQVAVSGARSSLTACSETGFSFNASHYTQEELGTKAHSFELEESPYTVLCLDYAQSGIGSGSCGPQLLSRYRLDEEAFRFSLNFQIS